jgi:bifunctional UDP-N-acetylglucosamine pyrophosphorylase/glucosamine-1-phosphate N-acetyltransferase
MKDKFLALVLAAGRGTRFKSERTKVLHPLLGESMLRLVLDCVSGLKPEKIFVVVGPQREDVMKEASFNEARFVIQHRQKGTAHAVMAARSVLNKKSKANVLIVNADSPLLRPETLKPMFLLHERGNNSLTFLSAEVEDPVGFGRVLRAEGGVRIIEEKEATAASRRIKEVNAGVYLFKIKELLKGIAKVSNKNRSGEYRLTDLIDILSREGKRIGIYRTSHIDEIVQINSRYELAKAIETLRKRKIRELTEQGVTVCDSHSTWVDLDVRVGMDTTIHSSVIIEGKSVIGSQCRLYPFVHIINSRIGNRVKILSSTFIEESAIEDDAQVGPFTRLRPKTVIQSGAKVGNFVEMKNTVFGRRSKAQHLTYLGDCQVEEDVNIGAGTITCNYDGRKKHKTFIEAGAFIGSGTELVAPLKVGKGAYIGAGSTITRDVAPESLAVTRSRQVEKRGWALRMKKK